MMLPFHTPSKDPCYKEGISYLTMTSKLIVAIIFLSASICFTDVSDGFPNEDDYIRFLEKFPAYAEREWHPNFRGDSEVGYFGSGGHDGNQIRSLSNFIFVYSLLASDPDYNPAVSGVDRETLLDHALAAIRYFTASHITGDSRCADFGKWGEEPEAWLSPWLITRVVAGAHLIWDELDDSEKDALKRVVVYDANFHLKQRASSREYFGSESLTNTLYGEMLAYAVCFYPDHPNANRWLFKAKEFFMNTFSVKQDANDLSFVDGRRVKDWVYTTNVHPDFTIECHGAYQFDYNACPLHSLTWAYYAFISNDRPVPEALFHHFLDVWNALKKTHLYQGRFAYLQGKDWARHVYGLYFIMPVLVLLQNEFNDTDARLIERLRFEAFQFEQNARGGLFTKRFIHDSRSWSLIYATDCYANMGLAYLLHNENTPIVPAEDMQSFQKKVSGTVESKYCEFIFSRSEKAFASFSWRHLSGEHPLGLFVPGDDYIVEWEKGNLIGYHKVSGYDMDKSWVTHNEQILDNGFVTTGRVKKGYLGSSGRIAVSSSYAIEQYISFTGLPDDGIAIVIDYSVANKGIYVTEHGGLSYYLPNDIFNGNSRHIYWQNGEIDLLGIGGIKRQIAIDSKWINVDDKLGIISALDDHSFTIKDVNFRNSWFGQLSEELYYPLVTRSERFNEGEVVRQTCFMLVSGDRYVTERMADGNFLWLETTDPLVKAVLLKKKRASKLIVANFSMDDREIELPLPGAKLIFVNIPRLNTIIYDVSAVSVEPADKLNTTFSKIKQEDLQFENYSNPSNPETWIPYYLTEEAEVIIRIYNIRGKLIRTLNLGQKPIGAYLDKDQAVYWDGRNEVGEKVGSGVYFYQISAGDFLAVRKMVILK